jgi:membrane fusion protein (multidrug efflux system)
MMKFTLLFLRFSLLTAIVYTVASCAEKKQGPPPIPEIPVVEVIQKDVPIYRQFVGQVYGNADIPIRARVAGFLEGIHFEEGFKVKKGQLLYSIDPSEYQSKVATQESYLAEAKTGLAKTKSDLDRIEPLAKINAVSQSDLDAARANYDASLAYVDAMEANLKFAKINLGYCWIKAPLTGAIGKTNARQGEFVGQEPNPIILNTVSTVDTVRVEFYLAEAEYIRIAREIEKTRSNDEEAAIRERNVSLILADGTTFKQKGVVDFVNREVDPQTGSLLVQTTFSNPEKLLKPGQYAKVVVNMENIKDGLLIPQRCVMELQGQFSVYVINSENKVENRQIVAGETIGDMLLVKNGLQAGEKVVIDALQKVSSGLVVKPQVTVYESKSNLLD